MYFLIALILGAMSAVQVPGDGSNLLPSPPRVIKTTYWELSQTTELWVRLSPLDRNHKPAPVSLIFYITFTGKKPPSEATEVTIRVQADPRFVAAKFSLNLRPQPGEVLNLVGPIGTVKNSIGTRFQYYPNCPRGDCAVTGIISYLPWQVFLRILQSNDLVAELLGTEVLFEGADVDALRAFAKLIDKM